MIEEKNLTPLLKKIDYSILFKRVKEQELLSKNELKSLKKFKNMDFNSNVLLRAIICNSFSDTLVRRNDYNIGVRISDIDDFNYVMDYRKTVTRTDHPILRRIRDEETIFYRLLDLLNIECLYKEGDRCFLYIPKFNFPLLYGIEYDYDFFLVVRENLNRYIAFCKEKMIQYRNFLNKDEDEEFVEQTESTNNLQEMVDRILLRRLNND